MTEVPGEPVLQVVPEPEPQLDDAALSRLVGLLDDAGQKLTVAFRHEIPEHSQRLLKTLGATYTIAADAPPCASACGHPECKEDAMDGRELLDRMDAGEPVREATFIPEPKTRRNRFGVTWTEPMILDAIRAWAAEHGAPPFAWQWSSAAENHPSKNTVAKHCGSWSSGIEAAGFPRPRQGRAAGRSPAPASGPDPEPAPPANGDLRAAGLSLIASVRVFLDALEKEIA